VIPTTQDRPRTRRRVPRALVPVAASALALAWAGGAVAAPPAINFDFSTAVPGTVLDAGGEGTGFTGIQNNTGDTEDLPANRDLDTAQSLLRITTTEGDNKANNRQQNALQVSFDGTGDYVVSTTLRGPIGPMISQDFQGGGIFVGPNQDNFVKIVINRNSNQTPQIEMHMDRNGPTEAADAFVKEDTLPGANRVDLSLAVDAQTGAVSGSYSIDGGATKTAGVLTLPNVAGPTAFGGILATNFSSTTAPPVTVNFDSFSVTGVAQVVIPGTPGGGTIPGQRATGELCAVTLPALAKVPALPRRTRLATGQLKANRALAQTANRKLLAIDRWLNAGLLRDDLCGGALTAAKFGAGVTTRTTNELTSVSTATPRPVPAVKAVKAPRRLAVTARNLRTNRLLSDLALRRAKAIVARLNAGLTGGDIRNSQITQSKLRQGVIITAATPTANPAAPTKTRLAKSRVRTVRFTAGSLRASQSQARQAMVLANALEARLEAGLQGKDFRDGSVTAADLAADIVR
jgi:hypothetical protein